MKWFVLAAAAAALALPATASAKEVQSISVCGPSDCNSTGGGSADTEALNTFRLAFEGGQVAGAPVAALGAVPVGDYYRIGIRMRGDDPPAGQFSVEMWYVEPDLIRWRGDDRYTESFKRVPPAVASILQGLSRDLKPYAAPRVITARIDGKRASDPSPYIGLFADLPTAEPALEPQERWASLGLTPDRANPWFNASVEFMYLPRSRVLFLGDPVKVGHDLATTIARDGNLPLPVGDGDGGWGRPVGFTILGIWFVVATVLFIISQRPRRPRPARQAQPTTA
jgi:hypothetical protein